MLKLINKVRSYFAIIKRLEEQDKILQETLDTMNALKAIVEVANKPLTVISKDPIADMTEILKDLQDSPKPPIL